MTTIPTVSPTELIRSSWGNTVAAELNTKTVKVDGSMPMTGPLVINASPGIRLRRAGDAPFLAYENTTGATRFGYVQGAANRLTYAVDGAAGMHQFTVEGVEKFKIDASGMVTTAGLDVNAGGVRIGGNGAQLSLIDTSTSANDFHDAYMAFFGAGVSMVSPGTRTGYIGYAGSTSLQIHNEVSGGAVSVIAPGGVSVTAGTAITFAAGGVERGRVSGASLLWGKTTAGLGVAGVEATATSLLVTTATNAGPNLYLRHNTDADATAYVQFAKSDGNIVSQITQDAVAPEGIKISNCVTTAPSDARLKNDLGPLVGAVDRLAGLRPHRFTWRAHPDVERDGFFADEVAAVVPEAVTGRADAVDAGGAVIAQQLDRSALIPLLTAAVLELVGRVDTLEGAH